MIRQGFVRSDKDCGGGMSRARYRRICVLEFVMGRYVWSCIV